MNVNLKHSLLAVAVAAALAAPAAYATNGYFKKVTAPSPRYGRCGYRLRTGCDGSGD